MNLRIALLLFIAAPLAAQPDATAVVERGRDLVTAGHLSGSVDSLMAARATLGIALEADDPDAAAWAGYYTALADYRLSYIFWGQDAARALQHAEQGAAVLEDALATSGLGDDARAEMLALKATLLGTQMGLDQSRAMSLGQAATQATATSMRLAPGNPRVLFQSATSLLNTPPEWGGDPALAATQLEDAITRFGASTGLEPGWGEDDANAWLGMAHLMMGDASAARPYIDRAASLNPSSSFVQYKLMPWLEQLEGEEG
ncbi:hypothetical protein [Rubrivirga sp.]|uniref:hypothetical protein n=1 Tax=Rubrivirga sp. TaxID=1885344 RepID=UPI003C785586